MRESSLPTEFAELSGYINYIQKKSAYEYSSSCPKCGGSTHPDGELPDRFIMLMPEIAKAKIPFGWCRVCNYKWWPGQKDNKPVDPETIALLQAQAKEAEDKREEERRIKLAEFSTGDLWNELHRRMGDEQREWWRKAGVPNSWQDYLKLGYIQDKIYKKSAALLHSPAYTIPYFGYGFVFKTIQYRLCNPDDPNDRYRFEADLGTSYYMTTPSLKIGDDVIVCEGAKKGMVTKIYGEPKMTVLAVPSKVDWRNCGILEAIKDCGRVYIIFDPDCYEQPPDSNSSWMPQPVLFSREIGSSARIIECPVKADDAFVNFGMTKDEWKALKKQAIKL
ncbi:MAG: hypothetical protein LUQ65_05660 [Candidatus Helarchaeota archaeon]|nr:hypothetical protein [Candidatus Helarchaeota archaeon]